MTLNNNLGRLRLLGLLEGISYILLLGICVPLKYLVNIPEPTQYIGLAHGILFIAYCLWVLIVAREVQWTVKQTLAALVASLLPFGTFVADARLFRKVAQQ